MPDDKDKHPCESKGKCQKETDLADEPSECTPEQIEKCHGADKDACCAKAGEK